MWVYTGEDVEPRRNLNGSEAFFLDYWLFLHADETHSVWRCRPIGLRTIAKIVLDKLCRGGVLYRAIGQELLGYRKLADYLSHKPPSSNPWIFSPGRSCIHCGSETVPRKYEWSQEWLTWVDRLRD